MDVAAKITVPRRSRNGQMGRDSLHRPYSRPAQCETKARLGTQASMERSRSAEAYHCCVSLCTNDSRYDEKKELTFVKFPTDKKEKKGWFGLLGFNASATARVISRR